jgi:hypothetical protein
MSHGDGMGMTTGFYPGVALIAGGPGARCAPGGEREGRSPLAEFGCESKLPTGCARDKARSHDLLAQSHPAGEREGRSPLAEPHPEHMLIQDFRSLEMCLFERY